MTTALLTRGHPAAAQTAAAQPATLLSNVRIFDGLIDQLRPGHLLIRGDKIAEVSDGEIQPPEGAQVIDGAGRVDGRTGVWLPAAGGRPERKVAAIGVRVQRGVTLHGFALNCDPDMAAFANMIPCGIVDAGATSLTAELGRDVPVAEVLDAVEAAVRAVLTA